MEALFLKILNMSLTASWLILAVVLLRFVLRKTPKWINCLLWAVVAVRLLCPVSLESAMSVLPSSEPIRNDFVYTETPQIQTGVELIDEMVNPVLSEKLTPELGASVNPAQVLAAVSGVVWTAGMIGFCVFALWSYWKLHRQVAPSLKLQDNIWICDDISTPFILGVFRPRIYIPSGTEPEQLPHIIAHEQAHLKRRDHWWKPLGYLALAVHWFNPLVWLAYILLCRDIEMACDEKVIRNLDKHQSIGYSEALLRCSVNRRAILVCPLAFGEVGVKERVKRVLRYKKPAFWIVLGAVIASMIVGICFLTNPHVCRSIPMKGTNVADLEPEKIIDHIVRAEKLKYDTLHTDPNRAFDIILTEEFDFENEGPLVYHYPKAGGTICGQVQLQKNPCQYYLTETASIPEPEASWLFRSYVEALKYLPQAEIRSMTPEANRYRLEFVAEGTPGNYDRCLTYTKEGVSPIDGWQIHFKVTPFYGAGGESGYDGAPKEAVHLFYDPTAVEDYRALSPETLLERVKREAFVVSEGSAVTAGKDLWQAFLKKTEKGSAATVRLAHYYGKSQAWPSCIYLFELIYQNGVYTIRCLNDPTEPIKSFLYLNHSMERPRSVNAKFDYMDVYFLTNDPRYTWGQIMDLTLISFHVYIPDCKLVYSENIGAE